VTGIWFRHADARSPFFWESADQPAGRWHASGEGPVQYLADTPDGAWAEFIRHEEITDPAELAGIERALWAVEVVDEDDTPARPALHETVLLGGKATYAACQTEARRVRGAGHRALEAPSAALVAGGARGQVVNGGIGEAPLRDGRVLVLFGTRPDLRGWLCGERGPSSARLLPLVRPL
jgi:RES domain